MAQGDGEAGRKKKCPSSKVGHPSAVPFSSPLSAEARLGLRAECARPLRWRDS